MVALQSEGEAQPLEIRHGELAVARLGAHRGDDPLDLEEAELAGGERGELRREPGQDLADAQKTRGRRTFAGGGGRHQPSEDAARSTGETKKFSRNFPTRTSAPLVSVARSTRSPLT